MSPPLCVGGLPPTPLYLHSSISISLEMADASYARRYLEQLEATRIERSAPQQEPLTVAEGDLALLTLLVDEKRHLLPRARRVLQAPEDWAIECDLWHRRQHLRRICARYEPEAIQERLEGTKDPNDRARIVAEGEAYTLQVYGSATMRARLLVFADATHPAAPLPHIGQLGRMLVKTEIRYDTIAADPMAYAAQQ